MLHQTEVLSSSNSLRHKVLTVGVPEPTWLMEKQDRVDQLVLDQLQIHVQTWVGKRKLLQNSDSKPERVTALLVGEVHEFIQEIVLHNGEALRSGALEMADIYFFVFAFLFGNQIEIDFSQVKNNINGQGATSKSLEVLLQLCGDLRDNPSDLMASTILSQLSSIAVHLGTYFDPLEVLLHKIEINTANYPIDALSSVRDGQRLTPDMWMPAFDHVVRTLRLVRRAKKISQGTNDARLLPGDYERYRSMVLNFTQPEQSMRQLALLLVKEYKVQYHDLMQTEVDPHRVVSGLGQQMLNVTDRESGVIEATRPKQVYQM